ncbi:unnamed protein product [Sphagnum troendelagicum]|uniref:histidinol-phosphatase n=1 Tax=Sphagnum troendelagicum TaxID=128251 RepID=A0ABP0U2B1_9BRYO
MALALVSGCSVALADIRSSLCPAVLLHSHCEFSSCCPVQVSANKNRTTTAAALLAARSLGCLGKSEIARDCCICSCRDEELTLSKPRTQAPMSALTQSGSVFVMTTTKKKKKIQDAIMPVTHSGKCWSSKSALEKKIRGAKSVRVRAEAEHLSAAMVDREEEDKNNKNKEECTREEMEEFVEVANKLADAAGTIIRTYFRTRFDIIDKADTSPVTIADRAAEEAMRTILAECFPTHAIYGEEGGLKMPEGGAKYTWVLDPIDGTKSFITGKPVFGTLIALVQEGVPVLGVIDQPVLRERWIGRQGHATTMNGNNIHSRSSCTALKNAYLYTTSPHLFGKSAEEAFIRVRNQVKIPLYGCDCYAYGLLAAGFVDLVVESGLKPYDFLALVPVVEGAGGVITDWHGQRLQWSPDTDLPSAVFEVIAAGSANLHKAAVTALAWR